MDKEMREQLRQLAGELLPIFFKDHEDHAALFQAAMLLGEKDGLYNDFAYAIVSLRGMGEKLVAGSGRCTGMLRISLSLLAMSPHSDMLHSDILRKKASEHRFRNSLAVRLFLPMSELTVWA